MKIKSILSIFLIFCLLICCISAVNAQNIDDNNDLFSNENVQTVADLADDDELLSNDDSQSQMLGDPATGSFKELQEKIDGTRANGVLELDKDYKYEDGDSIITISKSLTINGNGKTIDGANKINLLEIKKVNTILKNITFKNGKTDDYGGGN